MSNNITAAVVFNRGENESAGASWMTLCDQDKRRVWVERGVSSNRNIVFSSTFDSVTDIPPTEDAGSSERLHEAAFSSAITSCLEGNLAIVLAVGNDKDKRQMLLRALCESSVPTLLAKAESRGHRLVASALHLHWETLTDLFNGTPIEHAPSSDTPGGLWGASTRVISTAEEGASLLQALPAAAAAVETGATGAVDEGHQPLVCTAVLRALFEQLHRLQQRVVEGGGAARLQPAHDRGFHEPLARHRELLSHVGAKGDEADQVLLAAV